MLLDKELRVAQPPVQLPDKGAAEHVASSSYSATTLIEATSLLSLLSTNVDKASFIGPNLQVIYKALDVFKRLSRYFRDLEAEAPTNAVYGELAIEATELCDIALTVQSMQVSSQEADGDSGMVL